MTSRLTLFCLLFISTFLNAQQWTELDGPYGGDTRELIVLGETIFVNTANAIYKSEDLGSSWQDASSGLPTEFGINDMVENNGILYTSISTQGLFAYSNKINRWERVSLGDRFAEIFIDGNNFYIAEARGAIYYSSDGGETVNTAEGVEETMRIRDFELYNSKMYVGGSSLLESSDNGATWSPVVTPDLGSSGILDMYSYEEKLYLATRNGVLAYDANLNVWSTPYEDNFVWKITEIDNKLLLIAGVGSFVYRSEEGNEWETVKVQDFRGGFREMAQIGNTFLISSTTGMLRNDSLDDTWEDSNIGIRNLEVTDVISYNDRLLAATSNGLRISSENDDSWTSLKGQFGENNQLPMQQVRVLGDHAFIAGFDGIYTYDLVNQGEWEEKVASTGWEFSHLIYSSGTFLSTDGFSLFWSFDNGETWEQRLLSDNLTGKRLLEVAFNGEHLYAFTWDQLFYESTDLGQTWNLVEINGELLEEGISTPFIRDIVFSNDGIYIAAQDGVFFRNNVDGIWSNYNNLGFSASTVALDGERAYALQSVSIEGGVFATDNQRNNWLPFTTGFLGFNRGLFFNEEFIYVHTTHGIWRMPKSEFDLLDNERPFVTVWKTDNEGKSEDNQITIPIRREGNSHRYFYNVDWGDGTKELGVSNTITHTYEEPGTYEVSITGNFPRIFFAAGFFDEIIGDELKILEVKNWGSIAWESFFVAFSGCENLDVTATDIPNLRNTTSLGTMFHKCSSLKFNSSIAEWDVSNVSSISWMFRDAPEFNQDISGWDVSNVQYFEWLFYRASSFNQNLSNWDVGLARNFRGAFTESGLSDENYDRLLTAWSQLPNLNNDVELGAATNFYCAADARQTLIDDYGWIITDAGPETNPPVAICSPFELFLDEEGNGILLPENVDGGSSDECSEVTLSLSKTDFTTEDLGLNTIVLTVTDANGNMATCETSVTVSAFTEACPGDLPNESPDIVLPMGTLESGVDEVMGTSSETNGSECAIGVTNVDVGQPWGRYRISLDLLAQGLQAGDQLEIGIDGKDGTGNARIEVNVDNVPNSSLVWSNFGTDWSRFDSTVTVPQGATTLDIWLFSNYGDRTSAGTAYYDNLSIVKVDDVINECPDDLANESADIILPSGTLESGVDEVMGTSEETSGSECAIGVTNVDVGQPWGRYRISLDLLAQGLQAGDRLEIGIDGKDGTGNARMEVNVDNVPNSSLVWSNFGADWSRYSSTVTVPVGATTLDIWLFSNYADRTSPGTAYYDNLSIVKVDDTNTDCPDDLVNESMDIVLPAGTLESGVDEVMGTSEETNESECAIGVTNVDTAQPWGRYRITIDLAAQGLQAGDQLEIGVDGKDGTGNARMEVNVDNIPNSSIIWSNFGEDWSRFSGTVTVPADAATLDIWLFSNYADRDIAGTAYYDNLSVVKIGSSEASNNMVVYPNPSQNVFRLTFETPKELSQVFIYDVQGKLVKVSEEATGSNSSEYDVSDLPPGMYFVIAQDEKGDSFQKPIVIQR